MKNIALTLSYCGTNYHGWQRQDGFPTIQGTLENIIARQTKENVTLSGCGRTDKGVHAKTYCANFKSNTTIPPDRIPLAFNAVLPKDIVVTKAEIVPDDFDALLKLPGVGRKSANLIMGDVFGKPAIVTDTHCIRLVNRIGLVDGIKEPTKVEMALWKIIPPEEGSDLCHRLVYHGRDVCTARTKPHCDKCCLADICKKNGV